MNKFNGFNQDVFLLLELNQFNDSKDFYDSVKEQIKRDAIVPMRLLATELSEELFKLDDKMNLIPSKMTSRIRRDTRFSKNKHLYRANIWCMFMRDKHKWNYQPCMWFEIYPNSYNYGVGTFRTDAKYLECFREILAENQKEFKTALRNIEITNSQLFIECYKKDKPGIEKICDELKIYYNAKNFCFIHSCPDIGPLIDGSVKEELTYALRAFSPMYSFLLKVTERLYEKGDAI